jgi:hypothetical protein
MEYITPNIPPKAQIETEIQYGNPVHHPIITRPGSTKMIEESVPAAEATVWTMLFSWIVIPLNPRSTAMEMTAAGIEVAKVNPALRPKNTFAAVNTSVISTPSISPRTVSSFCACAVIVVMGRVLPEIVVVIVCGVGPRKCRTACYRAAS